MQDPLSQLRDLHAPTPPSWWPPAPGWWIAAMLCLAGLVLIVLFAKRRYACGAPRRSALSELDSLLATYQAGAMTALAYIDAANRVVKRLLIASGRSSAGPLSGHAWLSYLDELTQSTMFSSGPGVALGDARYRPRTDTDLNPAELHAALLSIPASLTRAAPAVAEHGD